MKLIERNCTICGEYIYVSVEKLNTGEELCNDCKYEHNCGEIRKQINEVDEKEKE